MSLENNINDIDDLDAMDLDSLDDLILEDADLSSFGEIDTDIPFPHVRIQTKQLQGLLRIAKLLSMASGRDVVSKSVSFHVEEGRLVCRATDFDSYLVQKFDLLNDENVLEDDFVIPIDILTKLSKACPATIAILKDEEGLKMRLAGGDIILETYTVPLEKFSLRDQFERISEVEAPSLLATIRAMGPIVTSAVNPTERRIVFKKGNAYASYMWALVTSIGDYPQLRTQGEGPVDHEGPPHQPRRHSDHLQDSRGDQGIPYSVEHGRLHLLDHHLHRRDVRRHDRADVRRHGRPLSPRRPRAAVQNGRGLRRPSLLGGQSRPELQR